MPLYSTNNPPCCDVGQSVVMFDGTETPAVGLKSRAIARGTQGSGDNGITFQAFNMPAGMTIDVQVAPNNVDAEYTTITTLVPSGGSPDSGNAAVTDPGRAPFYRLYMTAYTSGAMPTVSANR